MAELPTGTVTFLFTDIQGSTRLWEHAPDATRVALERHDKVLRSAIESYDGYVFSTGGDGFGVAFATAGHALQAATEIQSELGAQAWPQDAEIRVRIGVHTGEAVEREGDYFGPAVNRTARLMALAHGGQTVCSQATASLVDPSLRLQPLGAHRLRDLAAAEVVFQVGAGQFPALRSVDAVPTNLPTMLTELLGRDEEVHKLSALLRHERLVTLTGVGGVGKTRLALAAAAASAPRFADGVWLVELAPANRGDEVTQAAAATLRVAATDLAGVARYLSDKRMLLVLDNCEHLLADAAELAEALLAAGPDVVIIATSREPLAVDGEVIRGVRSLGVPEVDAELANAETSPAVQLFTERAGAAGEFSLTAHNLPAVIDICRHLDGIPLALELAAARVRAMPVAEIAGRLRERLNLLAAGRASQERHRTLQATISWSYDLLSANDRSVFSVLAVFPASFDLPGAIGVVGRLHPGIDTVELVISLVDRSMVQFDLATGRYRLLETLRQFGMDRLVDAGDIEEVRMAHAMYFFDLIEESSPGFLDARSAETAERLTPEIENVRAVAVWLIEHRRPRQLLHLATLADLWLEQAAPVDSRRWLRTALELNPEVPEDGLTDQEQVDALGRLAHAQMSLGRTRMALELINRSLSLAETSGAGDSIWAWSAKAHSEMFAGDLDASLQTIEYALELAKQRNDLRHLASTYGALANTLAALGRTSESRTAAETGLEMSVASGQSAWIAALASMDAAAAVRGRPPDFGRVIETMERHAPASPDTVAGAWCHVWWGVALVTQGEAGGVAQLVAAILAADRLVLPPIVDLGLRSVALAAARTGRLDDAARILGYARSTSPYRTVGTFADLRDGELDEQLAHLGPQRHTREDEGQRLSRRELNILITALAERLKPSAS